MWAGPLIYLWLPSGNNPTFSNLGLCAACCAHYMCHHELWRTPVSHPFSSLNSSLGFAGGRKHYQKLLFPSLDLFFKILLFQVTFQVIFYHYFFSLRSSGWFVIAVCGSISVRELVKCLESLWTDVALPSPMTSQFFGCPHFWEFLFLMYFSLTLIVASILCVIHVRGDTDSNV